ncbi:MAG: N,N-dimethylformamidase beta subunit family domain-containing protein [Parvibaculaceae bacterium]
MLKITGYPDRYSAVPGEDIAFKISLEEGKIFSARLVRVIHGDCNPDGPGLKFRHVPSNIDGEHAGGPQRIDAGSYMIAESLQGLAAKSFTIFANIWPTLPARADQTLFAQWDDKRKKGFRVTVDDSQLSLVVSDGKKTETFTTGVKMLVRKWYTIAVLIDLVSGEVALTQNALRTDAFIEDEGAFSGKASIAVPAVAAPFMIAGTALADGTVGLHYDGKIDGPVILAGAHDLEAYDALLAGRADHATMNAIIARWDFSREIRSTRAVDIGPSDHHGELIHFPTRAMKGWNWTGEFHDWKQRPEHYGAIHFHHDDVYDAGWKTSLTLTLPKDLKSGPYALHVECGPSDESATREDYLAFFVRPPRTGGRRAKVLLLAPTASYIAYANHGEHITARGAELQMNRLLTFGHSDLYMYEHPELGGSLYDNHADGSGVCYSSRLRPVLNFSARYHSWLGGHGSALYQYNADTHLFDWLDNKGVDYDVITDEDLHEEGYSLLKDYRVVITGTHPEYHSTRAWDAMMTWIERGGRLMYMGGNGWYWRVAFHDTHPGIMELRRAEDGIRTWFAEPGEYYHSFSGEYGGLWRRQGRAPNVICGVGFIAQGFDISSYYRRAPDADNPRVAFIFEGVPDEIIGDFGLIGGGAAGIELDCIATDLGSPPNMLRLASSEGHSSTMALVNEEFGVVPPNLGGDTNPRVRADMAFGETPSGGALFATSSIAWCGSLSHNNYDNNVSRITWNVLKRFMDETPFDTGA